MLDQKELLAGVKDAEERIEVLTRQIFLTAFHRVARGLLHEDQVTFAMRLAQIRIAQMPNAPDSRLLDFLMRGGLDMPNATIPSELSSLSFLTEQQQRYLVELNTLSAFNGIIDSMSRNAGQWEAFIRHSTPEEQQPPQWDGKNSKQEAARNDQSEAVAERLRMLLLLKGLRPDRLTAGGNLYVAAVFGSGFLTLPELDLSVAVDRETSASTPLLLCSTAGYDASYRVDALAAAQRR